MDLRKLKSLLELMDQHSLAEMEVEEEGMRVKLRKLGADRPTIVQTSSPGIQVAVPPPPAPAMAVAAAPPPPPPPAQDRSILIKSPMVGTFYRAAKPDAPPFTDVGKPVGPESVVCIIEAMKVMNEIKAECSGMVSEFLVQNGEAIEYGQPLIRITPKG